MTPLVSLGLLWFTSINCNLQPTHSTFSLTNICGYMSKICSGDQYESFYMFFPWLPHFPSFLQQSFSSSVNPSYPRTFCPVSETVLGSMRLIFLDDIHIQAKAGFFGKVLDHKWPQCRLQSKLSICFTLAWKQCQNYAMSKPLTFLKQKHLSAFLSKCGPVKALVQLTGCFFLWSWQLLCWYPH